MPITSCWLDGRPTLALAGLAAGVFAIAVAATAGPALAAPRDAAAPPLGTPRGEPADTCDVPLQPMRRTVTAVPDAEHLQLDDGTRVKLVGTLPPLAPLSAEPGQPWPAAVAAHDALRALALGKRVALASSSLAWDRYGTRLAQVFVEADEGGAEAVWVQGALLASGHARAYAIPGDAGCIEALIAAESLARSADRGIWADPAYEPRRAHRPQDLAKSALAYELVEGRVRRASRGRSNLFISFTGPRRGGFTVIVPGPLASEHPAWSASLLDLAGKRVRVRGWIIERNGPAIEITHPSEIELLDTDRAPR